MRLGGRWKFTDAAAAVLLAVLVLVAFHDVVGSGRLIYGQDIIEQGYPQACFERDCALRGETPIWNPYIMGGIPNYSSAPFYPLDLLTPYVSPRLLVNWKYISHTFLACLLMFILMRRWRASVTAALISAMAFAFSGFFVPKIFAGHGAAFTSGVWIPLVFLMLDMAIESRRWTLAALAGGIYGLQVLGQHPQYAFYTLAAIPAYTIYRTYRVAIRPFRAKAVAGYVGLLGIMGLFAAGLSAVYALPFAQLTALSSRGGGTGYQYAASSSLPPADLLTAIAPNFWGSPASSNSVWGAIYWDASLYVGMIPLMLAVIAMFWAKQPRAAFFKWLVPVSLLLALGGHTPLYKLIYHIPGFSLMRVPSKAILLYVFAVAVLAGFGLDALPRRDPRGQRKLNAGLIAAPCVAAVVFVLYWLAKPFVMSFAKRMIHTLRTNPQEALQKLNSLYHLQIETLAAAVVFTAVGSALIWYACRKGTTTAIGAGLVVMTFADLALFGAPLIGTVDPAQTYGFNSSEVAFLSRQPGRFRILPLKTEAFKYSQGMLNGMESVNGYYPVVPKRYSLLASKLNNRKPQVTVSVGIRNYTSHALDLLNVRYVLSLQPIKAEGLKLVHHGSSYIYERPTLPRAFIVHSAELAPDGDAAMQRLLSPDFRPGKQIVLETPTAQPMAGFANMREDAVITRYENRRIDLGVRATAPGYLFLSENYYPGWKALVDGEPTPIVRANYLFRAVPIQAGQHLISFIYDPLPNRIGKYVSAATLLALTFIAASIPIAAGIGRMKRKKSRQGQ